MISQKVKDLWDKATISEVSAVLERVPQDLHRAVVYLGGMIAGMRASLEVSPPYVPGEDQSDILEEYNIDPGDVEDASDHQRLSQQEILEGYEQLLRSLVCREYPIALTFFQERLNVFKWVVSCTASVVEDFDEASAYLQRNTMEQEVLEAIVATLSQYIEKDRRH